MADEPEVVEQAITKPAEPKDEAEIMVTLMHNKLSAAFDLFDGEKSKSVDVK